VHEAVHGLQQHPFHGRAGLGRQVTSDSRQLFPGDVFATAAHPPQRRGRGPAGEPAQVAPQFGLDGLLGGRQVADEVAGLGLPAGPEVGQVDQPDPGQRALISMIAGLCS
jgi:hypothetical protein